MNPDTVDDLTESQRDACEDAAAVIARYVATGPRFASERHIVGGCWVEAMAVRDRHPASLPWGFATVHTVVDVLRWKFIEDDACAQFGPPPSWTELVEPADWWPS